jgi:hypothetical protein
MVRCRTSLAIRGSAALALALAGLAFAPDRVSAQPLDWRHLTKMQQRLADGLLSSEINPADLTSRQRSVLPLHPTSSVPGYQPGPNGCPERRGANIKVNQNCLNLSDGDLQGRAQAQNETWAAADPRHPQDIVAAYNDYRRGDGTCGASYSLDNGKSWADSTVPDGFTRGEPFGAAREYWEAGGDPSVAWDTRGNAYLNCMVFQRGSADSTNPDLSSGVYLFRSTGNHGASWNFTGRPVIENRATAGGNAALIDKPLMAVDNHVGSPFQDRVYVTWTTFATDGTAYIFEAHSSDYGEHFSAPVLVSEDSSLCNAGNSGPLGRCTNNQFSQPFTGPDGSLYVVFNNYNNKAIDKDNRNQVLLVRSTDGGATFSAPVRAGWFYDLPDCLTYQGQDAGRACVPEKGTLRNSFFRAADYPVGAVDPRDRRKVVVTIGSYINRDSNETSRCAPAGFSAFGQNLYTGVKNGGCNNKIMLSSSTDFGTSFTGTTVDPRDLPVVGTSRAQAHTDQFWQAASFASNGSLAVSSYDRQYGDDETTGFSDVTVSTARDLVHFDQDRATSASMPPPTEFSGEFFGDYAGLAVSDDDTITPVWMDTRQLDLFACPSAPPATCTGTASNARFANDQDIYSTRIRLG